jgi:hypothetical protein
MTNYIPALEKVQLGLEAVWGDLAAPTVQLVGVQSCKITPKVESAQILDKRGTTMPAYLATVNKVWAEADVEGVVCYTHFRHWLDAMFGIDAVAPYGYLADLDAAVALRSFLLCYGQPDVTYSAGGMILDKLAIAGKTDGPLTFKAHLLGKGVSDDALEALTDDTVVVAMGNHCALYIDPIAGPIGTTPVLATAFAFEANIECDRKLLWHLGSLNPDGIRHGKWGGSLNLTLQMTSDMQDILDAVLAQVVAPGGYAIRIKATDSLTTSILTLDNAGQLLEAPVLYTDNDGTTTVELAFTPVFSDDATFLSCWGAALVVP